MATALRQTFPTHAAGSRPPVFSPRTRGSTIPPAPRPIREILSAYEIVPRKRHGQNFLHDPAVAERIVAAAALAPGDTVLEIGPGLGAITKPLLRTGAHVVSIEIDPRLARYLRDDLGDQPRFRLLEGDALAVSWDAEFNDPFALVANLPYAITGPILDRLIGAPEKIRSAVLMMQKEVATRLGASPGGKEIGAPSVLVQLLFQVEKLFDVGSGAFQPAPDVVSSVVRFTPRHNAGFDADLRALVNRAYLHRRKMVRKTLAGCFGDERVWAKSLEVAGHSASARPEELAPDEWPLLLARVRGEQR